MRQSFVAKNPAVLVFLACLGLFTLGVSVLSEGLGIGLISTSFVKTLCKTLCLCLFPNDSGPRGNNGLSGLQNIPGAEGVPQSVISVWFLWASAAALGLGYVIAAFVVSGKFGSVIRGIRDDEARARFPGYSVEGYKLFVFTLTAVIAGIAGALYYPQAGIIIIRRRASSIPRKSRPSPRSTCRSGWRSAGVGGFTGR